LALNVYVLCKSFDVIAEANPNFVTRFFDNLFERYPSARPLFSRSLRDQQERMFREVFVSVLAHLGDAPWLEQTLGALGAKHVEYGVTPEMYEWVGESLLATLAEVAGPAWNSELCGAWADAYRTIATLMQARTRP